MKPQHRGMAIFALVGTLAGFTLGYTERSIEVREIIKVREVTLEVKDFAKELLNSKQYMCLDYIATKESRWNPKSVNKTSKASGIGQLLPFTWNNIGYIKTENPHAQVMAMLIYIGRHYGSGSNSVCKAAQHSEKYGWY